METIFPDFYPASNDAIAEITARIPENKWFLPISKKV
jgi:hypothetical protein